MDTVTRLVRRLFGLRPPRPAVPGGPRVLPAYAALARYRTNPVELEPQLRMLVTQLAAERSRCRWCIENGRHRWREARLPIDLLRNLVHYETSPLFSARERAALRFTDALTRYTESNGAGGMPVAPLEAVRRHLTEPEVAALTAAAAEMHFFNPITGELGADAGEGLRSTGSRSAWGAPLGTALRNFWL